MVKRKTALAQSSCFWDVKPVGLSRVASSSSPVTGFFIGATNATQWLAVYSLQRPSQKSQPWRISGCVVMPNTARSA